MNQPRALLSVYDKKGLEQLAKALAESGYELVSSGGTAKFIQESGLRITPVESITGNPEAFDGRMKTLSFQVESSILFDRSNPKHQEEAKALHLIPIDVVVCNFYPFHKALEEKLPLEQAIELIDIGGPAMVRAAAKNFHHVLVLVDPDDYPAVCKHLQTGQPIPIETRLELAAKAFKLTADYDSAIDTYFQEQMKKPILRLRFENATPLRYGENPQQKGVALWSENPDPLSLARFRKVSGKELSFNNFLDGDAAINVLASLDADQPACVIVKHTNPCGVGMGETLEEAFEKAWQGDPVAAFGGIVALNRPISSSLIQKFLQEKKFVEIFLAPGIEESAQDALAKNKKNLILLVNPTLATASMPTETDIKKIRGGILMQEPDRHLLLRSELEVVSEKKPSESQWRDLLFAWRIAKESKSNSIVIANHEQLVGAGVGQQDRVRACKLAVEKAGGRAKKASAASDGFFPFADGPEVLISAGVEAIIHPGGSIRDGETIALCNKHGVALVSTKGIRGFKH